MGILEAHEHMTVDEDRKTELRTHVV